jgi:phage terminase small subunit
MSDREEGATSGPTRKLDARETRFVQEYLVSLDPKQAALTAGYSETVAASKAYQWVSNGKVKPHVFAAVQEAQAERAERTKIDADWVLTRLATEANADLADILDDAGAIKPVAEWPLIWRQGLVAGIDITENTVDGVKMGETVKLRLSDRIKRIELIGKHVDVRAFSERHEHTGAGGGPIQTEEVSAIDRINSRLDSLIAAQPEGDDISGAE